MLNVKRYFFIFLVLCIPFIARTQEYYTKQYRVEKGLPSDIIKGCAQDSLGYFWIATDEGLVKYDGIRFTSYRRAMHSNYAKGVFKTRSGRLLAFGDLDLIEIKNQGDTVLFDRLCPVSRVSNDSSLTYPKLIYEDAQGALWISESQAVVRLQNNTIKRFEFDLSNRSPQFLRSFTFFEDKKQNLFVSSFQGNVFRYNRAKDSFESVAIKFPPDVEVVLSVNDTLLIGAREGIFRTILLREGGYEKPVLQKAIPFVSFITAIPNGKFFIATRGRQHTIADVKNNVYTPYPNPVNNINNVYVSYENDIWLSGNEGLIMTRENIFQRVNENVTDFIESITEDINSPLIYYATSQTLYSYNRETKKNAPVLNMPNGYFQSLLFTESGLWASNAFRVFLLTPEGKVKKEFDFTRKARFITALSQDEEGTVWLAMPGSAWAYRIDSAFKLDSIRADIEKGGVINVIRGGKDGTYIASTGKDSYLFFKSSTDSVFRNVSPALPFTPKGDFDVTDIQLIDGKIWLASTEGLLKIEAGRVAAISLGDLFVGLPVKSLYLHSENKLMASTPYGMIFYDVRTGQHDLFNEASGLLSNTITNHGFFVGVRKRIWIGTAKGLSASVRPLSKLTVTPKPLFIQLSANGIAQKLNSEEELAYGSFISIEVSSITFPENEVTLQYRIAPESEWKTTEKSEIQFSAMKAGTFTLEVRAKKNGLYTWSGSSFYNFTIGRPYWQQPWFYIGLLTAALFLVAITITWVNARNRKRTLELERLVDERTQQLQLRNQELIDLNEEKNNLIGIVAHDLKSPLKQILGVLSLIRLTAKPDEETDTYLTMMENSTKRLDGIIMKILDVEAIDAKTLNLNIERLSFSNVLNGVVDRYENDAAQKNIVISRSIYSGIFVAADKGYLDQVLENLLSNAIKFSPPDRKIFINLTVKDGRAIAAIKDEGPGLSPSDHKKLFGKFQKLSAQPTGSETSTGLGLSIVKKFVLAMKGEIWCESELGSGATFFVSFTHIKQ